MKRVIIVILWGLMSVLLSAQVPQGFNYQAIARDASGNPISGSTLQVKLGILSDTTTPVIVWEELHNPVNTNTFGLFSLVIGNGSQSGGTAVSFSAIDWKAGPLYIKTQIFYLGTWKYMGSAKLWSVPYAMIAGDLSGTVKKLAVTGETSDMEEALFEVKNKNGQTVFAVYNEGVRVYVADGVAKGSTKGGFAIGGFSTVKGTPQNYFVVNSDSIRAYIDTNPGKGATKGGFAIGGFATVKTPYQELFRVTQDSTRIYLNDSGNKTTKGGFAIGGFNSVKGIRNDYLLINPVSTNFYVRTLNPLVSSTFNILAINQSQVQKSLMNANLDTINIGGVMNVQNNLVVSGNIDISGTVNNLVSDIDGNSYNTVTIGTQVWMKENLKTTKYRNGDLIGTTTPATLDIAAESTPQYQWAYGGNESNVAAYGRLYTWYAIMDSRNVCPTDWHVSTDAEWTTLTTYLGGLSVAGGKLKETGTIHWASPNTGASNDYSFSALPGGERTPFGTFQNIVNRAYFWTATENDVITALYHNLFYNDVADYFAPYSKKEGYSVRCLKN